MSGGAPAGGGGARVRIKGRKGSVIRFLIISIGYTLPWIIMLSQLAYYSKVYGPQVLLQLNIAYYLPSIPVLLLFGQVEELLDAEFGQTSSMAMRLMAGLAACAALAAYYPFMPTHLTYLLGLVVVLGAVSSVAFSTSYQLVAWFRSADTIALGIGCVASGPLALVIQIALQIGTKPKHWQWIAQFEIAAAMVVVGMLAALSLLWQYWGILSGREHYDDGSRQPLLDSEVQEQRIEEEADEQALMLSRMLTLQDPFQGFPFTMTPGMVMPHPATVGLRRAASDDITDRRRHARSDRAAVAAEAGAAGLKPSAAATAAAAAATAAAAGRHLKHNQTYAGRASAAHGAPYDGHTRAAAAGTGNAGMSSSSRSGSIPPAAAAAAGGSGGPTAAAVAANARAASLQHYSGLPMVQPPGSSSAAAAWLPDLEQQQQQQQQQQQFAAGGSSIGTASTNLDTPKDPFWLSASVASASPRSSRAPSPGPYSSTAAGRRCDSPAAAVPAPAFTAGSYVGELPQWGPQEQQLLQRTLLSSVLGGSAPVMPLAASLADDSDPPPCLRQGGHDTDSSDEEQGSVSHAHAQEHSEGSPVSHAHLQQALQQHLHTQQHHHHQQQQQGQLQTLYPAAPQQQQQQEHPTVTAARKGGGHHRTGSTASAAATSVTTGPAESVLGGEEGKEAAESLADVFVEVLRGTWMVVLAALISSTLINCIFPFFTYVTSSGMLGEFLPQVLFYTRMLADIVGRMLPRRKMWAITAPAALLVLAGGLLIASVAFFVYLQAPPHMQHDPYVLLLILLLWLCGGYINTMSYILAPSLVAPRVCTKASALMALTYQVAHILGLVLATGIALALYGDIAGEL